MSVAPSVSEETPRGEREVGCRALEERAAHPCGPGADAAVRERRGTGLADKGGRVPAVASRANTTKTNTQLGPFQDQPKHSKSGIVLQKLLNSPTRSFSICYNCKSKWDEYSGEKKQDQVSNRVVEYKTKFPSFMMYHSNFLAMIVIGIKTFICCQGVLCREKKTWVIKEISLLKCAVYTQYRVNSSMNMSLI